MSTGGGVASDYFPLQFRRDIAEFFDGGGELAVASDGAFVYSELICKFSVCFQVDILSA